MGLLILVTTALVLLVAMLSAILAHEMTHPPRHTAGYAVARGLPVDPGDLGWSFEEWWLERPGSIRLPVWEVGGEGSGISGQRSAVSAQRSGADRDLTVVFVHGWGHSRIDMLERAASWAPLCARIVLYDLRGHGDATGTSRLGDGEEDDLLALLERLGDGPFMLVGHSMGAVIALRAATMQLTGGSATIAGVVAYGPYIDVHASLRGRLRSAGFPARPITDLAMFWHRMTGLRPADASVELAGAATCPLLIVHGSDDRVAPIGDGRRLARATQDGTLLEVSGAGHLDAQGIDAAAHDQAVAEFVARVSSRWANQPPAAPSPPGSVIDQGSRS